MMTVHYSTKLRLNKWTLVLLVLALNHHRSSIGINLLEMAGKDTQLLPAAAAVVFDNLIFEKSFCIIHIPCKSFTAVLQQE